QLEAVSRHVQPGQRARRVRVRFARRGRAGTEFRGKQLHGKIEGAIMTKARQTLISWLRDAHAMERASVDSLDRMSDRLARFPQLAAGFRDQWQQTLEQAQRIEVCLKKLGSDTSTFKDLATRFIGITQAYAVAVTPDEVVKDCLSAYAWRYFEMAAYTSLG